MGITDMMSQGCHYLRLFEFKYFNTKKKLEV